MRACVRRTHRASELETLVHQITPTRLEGPLVLTAVTTSSATVSWFSPDESMWICSTALSAGWVADA